MARRPLPEVARRLRVVFPELWTRYELLAAARTSDLPLLAARAGNRRSES